jgi:predicted TPR repeat methyltransferase
MMQRPESQQELHDLLVDAFESHRGGKLSRAETLYRRLLHFLPDSWQIHFNLGLLLYEQDRFAEACSIYALGLGHAGPNADLLFNYGISLKCAGRLEEALSAYEGALKLEPENIEIHFNRASCLAALQRFEEAIDAYEAVISRAPDYLPAMNNQAYLCHRHGRTEKAIQRYRQIIALDPEHSSADHMLAALTGSARRTTPESYIQDVFDEYSSHYDTSLIELLHYNAPGSLLELAETLSDGDSFSAMLDLGCGTGLLGEAFLNRTALMHGVDLSKQMLGIARGKKIYDVLSQSSISDFLLECEPDSYDLVVAGDVFNYIGELAETFTLVKQVITEAGLFLFTVENLNDCLEPMRLNSSGRFAHTNDYIEQTSRRAGWEVLCAKGLDLRCEGGSWVQGTMYGLRNPRMLREQAGFLNDPAEHESGPE